MRPDQIQRLAELQERLADRFLNEADPNNWNGGDKLPANMTRDERGDSYWCKKNAAATLMLMTGVEKLQSNTKEALGRDPYEEEDLDAQIKKAEARAREAAERVMTKAKAAT